MKFLFSALLVFFLAVLSAGEITLDKEWRIVLPVSGKDPAMERHLRREKTAFHWRRERPENNRDRTCPGKLMGICDRRRRQ